MFVAAFITFCSFMLLISHVAPQTMRRLVGYKGKVDLVLHGTVIAMFIGTSTDGLLQAEAAAIMFSLFLRGYRYTMGYESLERSRFKLSWVRYPGRFS